MNIKDKYAAGGIPASLVRAFLLSALLGFALLLALHLFLRYCVSAQLPAHRMEQLLAQAVNWDDFTFPSVNESYYLGAEGRLFLLKANGAIVYSSDELQYSDFLAEDLSCIPTYGTKEQYSLWEYQTKAGESRALLTKSLPPQRKSASLLGYVILDSTGSIVDGTLFPQRKKLTALQQSYLLGFDEKGLKIQKYVYRNKLGQDRILVFSTLAKAESPLSSTISSFQAIWQYLLLLYLLLVLFFAVCLYLQADRRLRPLRSAVDSLSKRAQHLGLLHPEQDRDEALDMAGRIRKVTEKLAESQWESAYLDNSKHKLLADLSHDIRTPITVIQGCALALRKGLIPPDQHQKYIETIYKKSERVSELLSSFYEYSKLQHPDMPTHFSRQDLSAVLQIYFANKYEELELAGFTLEAEIPDCRVEVNMDDALFCRVLENLVNNSLKYNPPGTSLFVRLECKEDRVLVFIGDTGIGLSPDLEDQLFEPFVTSERASGSGLGLTIAKKIITLHRGTISYLKNPPHPCRTEFLITLPKTK